MSVRHPVWRLALLAAFATSLLALPASAAGALPPIRHVFVIVLENESASTTFGPISPAPYLSQTLRSQGAYVPNYYGIGHNSLDNYIAMISGQAPNPDTQADCQMFVDMTPGTIGSGGQSEGRGCVYPAGVPTIASQLTGAGLTWRGYNDGMGADPAREAALCGHPPLGARDNTQSATATDQYATRHNPFMYFRAIIDDTALCDSHVVNLDLLQNDLANSRSTPNFVFISPNLCNDGHDAPCANGQPGGLVQADSFLKTWVPRITNSPAFQQQDGLLIINFDEATTKDTTSCCGEMPGLSSPLPGVTGPGGGDTGAVMLSPCIIPGTVTQTAYNHYSMLRSTQDILGLSHIAYADLQGESSFGSDIFTRACTPSPPVVHLKVPKIASNASALPKVPISWSATDASGTAGTVFNVQVQQTSGHSRAWRTLLSDTTQRSLRFKAAVGRSYQFRVQAVNGAGQSSAFATSSTVVPSTVSVPKGHYSGKWHRASVRGAWKGHAQVAIRAGASFTLRYVGGALAIVGERGPGGGSAAVRFGGHTRNVSFHSKHKQLRKVVFSARARSAHHTLSIRVLHGTVAIEGLAISRRTS